MIALLDYGSGNIRSAERALATTGEVVQITTDFETCLNADGLVVPGVGAFGTCIEGLRAQRGDELIQLRLASGRPTLGICVGMQILYSGSDESPEVAGIGIFQERVERLGAPIVPQMGWNRVRAAKESSLLQGLDGELFYFVHSYAVKEGSLQSSSRGLASESGESTELRWSTCDYGERLVATVEYGSLSATQFHPEKSGEAGLRLLENWVRSW